MLQILQIHDNLKVSRKLVLTFAIIIQRDNKGQQIYGKDNKRRNYQHTSKNVESIVQLATKKYFPKEIQICTYINARGQCLC